LSRNVESSDGTEVTLDPATARVLTGLRLLLVAKDQERAERFASDLRKWDVEVEVLEAAAGADLTTARGLDPEVVLLDPTSLGGAALTLTRALNADERLRWASVLRCELDKVWPNDDGRADLWKLASLLAPLVNAERSLRERVTAQEAVLTELDRIGPNRMLRLLTSSDGAYALTVQSPDARAELMIDQGEIATAIYDEVHVSAPPVSGEDAVDGFMTLRSGVVEVVRTSDAAFGNDVTAQMGPPMDLLDALREEDDDLFDETLEMDPITEEQILLRDIEELPGEETLANEKTLVDRPKAEITPAAFPLPALLDDALDEVTKRNDDITAPEIDERQGEPSAPPMPPRPQFSPRESAERGSSRPPPAVSAPVELPELTAAKPAPSEPPVAAGPGSDAPPSVASEPPSSPVAAPEPRRPVSAPTALDTVRTKPSDAPSKSPALMLAAAIVGLGLMIGVGIVVWGSGPDGGEEMASRQVAEPAAVLPSRAVLPDQDGEEPAPAAAVEPMGSSETETETDPAPVEEPAAEEPPAAEEEPPVEAPVVAAPSDSTLTPREQANQIVDRADELELLQAADEALVLYEEALAIDSVNARALVGVARVHLAQNNPSRALGPASRATGLAPNRSSYRMLLGDVHFAMGDIEAARTVWLAAYEMRPSARLRGRLDRVGRPVDEPATADGTQSPADAEDPESAPEQSAPEGTESPPEPVEPAGDESVPAGVTE